MKDSRFCYFSISFIAWVLEREQTEVPKRRMERGVGCTYREINRSRFGVDLVRAKEEGNRTFQVAFQASLSPLETFTCVATNQKKDRRFGVFFF